MTPRRTRLGFGLLIMAAVALAGTPKDRKPLPPTQCSLSGALVKALSVASLDLEQRRGPGRTPDGGLSDFLASVSNYTFQVAELPSAWTITASPMQFRGEFLEGGGARYLVGKDSFEIIERVDLK